MSGYFTAGEARAALALCILAIVGLWSGRFLERRAVERTSGPAAVSADSLARSLIAGELARRKAPVAVNRAGVEELTRLDGIGPALAGRIVEERKRGGPFEGPQDLVSRVNGIGPLTVERLADRLVFSENAGGDPR